MFKFRIYIDTSVIGGSYDSEFKEWSKKLMTEFKHGNRIAVISDINKVDVLVSWNFKHIVNINRIRKYNAVNLKYGYQPLEIRSPREVLDEDEE